MHLFYTYRLNALNLYCHCPRFDWDIRIPMLVDPTGRLPSLGTASETVLQMVLISQESWRMGF
jgi:hypothetical protein